MVDRSNAPPTSCVIRMGVPSSWYRFQWLIDKHNCFMCICSDFTVMIFCSLKCNLTEVTWSRFKINLSACFCNIYIIYFINFYQYRFTQLCEFLFCFRIKEWLWTYITRGSNIRTCFVPFWTLLVDASVSIFYL